MQTLRILSKQKWLCCLYIVFLFIVLSLPITYKFTHKFLHKLCKICTNSGCPTICGILIHGLILLFILRIIIVSFKEGLITSNNKNHTHTITKKQIENALNL